MYKGKSFSNQAYNKIFNVVYLSSFDKLTLAIISDNKVCSIFEFFELNEFLDCGEKKYKNLKNIQQNEEKMVFQSEEEKKTEQLKKEILKIKKSYWNSKLSGVINQK